MLLKFYANRRPNAAPLVAVFAGNPDRAARNAFSAGPRDVELRASGRSAANHPRSVGPSNSDNTIETTREDLLRKSSLFPAKPITVERRLRRSNSDLPRVVVATA